MIGCPIWRALERVLGVSALRARCPELTDPESALAAVLAATAEETR